MMTRIHDQSKRSHQDAAILPLAAAMMLMAWPTGSLAQGEPADPDANPSPTFLEDWDAPFHVQARMGQWYPAFGGDFIIGNNSNSVINAENTLGLDDNEPTFNGNIRLRFPQSQYNRWELSLDFFDFDTEAVDVTQSDLIINGTTIGAGATLRNDMSVSNLALHLGYDFFGDILNATERSPGTPGEGDGVDLRFQVLGGIRALGVDHRLEEITPGTLTASYDETNLALELGFRLTFRIDPPWSGDDYFDVSTNVLFGVGGSDEVDFSTFNIGFEIGYMLNPNMGFLVGYRQIDFNISDTSNTPYDYDNRLAGLYAGGTIRF